MTGHTAERTGSFTGENASPSRTDVWKMFDRIAHRYDLLNRLLSCGLDTVWRKRVASYLTGVRDQTVLDLATGTADVLLSLYKHSDSIGFSAGIDLSGRMLKRGAEKIASRNLSRRAALLPGNAEEIPFRCGSFHAVTVAFGIRNVTDTGQALREIFRVLKPGGRALILEFSLPRNAVFRRIYLFYFRKVLPRIGSMVSGDSHAYRYLNDSVETFPYGAAFAGLMRQAGFTGISVHPLSWGIASIYCGDKP